MKLKDCKIIELPKISDPRGNLTYVEWQTHVPFDVERVYYLYDVPGGSNRGAHAHKLLKQLVIAVAGSFDVVLSDGERRKKFTMNRPNLGLLVCPMMWRDLGNFSSGAVCLVLASEQYNPSDYIRDYEEFKNVREGLK